VVPGEDGRLVGAMPLYLKNHSYGEYVFDWGWANAYENAGRSYYPKLQCCVPFTPVTGPRFLVREGVDREAILGALIAGLQELTSRHGATTAHVTFATREEWQRLEAAGFLPRLGLQYHWSNPGYGSFQDFLDALVSRKRKMIRKERKAAAESGVEIEMLTGADLRPEHWDAFFRFYMSTSDRKWGQAYLNREFFQLLGERLADRVLLVMGRKDGRWVAGALNLIGRDTLYGRNWGCRGHFEFLHFEACYYRAIEFAIERGLKRVEAGAQGEHKILRGYLPVETYSAHWITDPGFREAVAEFVARERRSIRHEIRSLEDLSPFRREDA
jgi:predicted N-acyltransferase